MDVFKGPIDLALGLGSGGDPLNTLSIGRVVARQHAGGLNLWGWGSDRGQGHASREVFSLKSGKI